MQSLLDTLSGSDLFPLGHCYLWQPDILWLHVGSNIVITFTFLIIATALLVFVRRNKNTLAGRDIIYLFIALIFFCGMSHLLEVFTTWHSTYLLEGWIKAATASISLITTLVLIPQMTELFSGTYSTSDKNMLNEELHSLEMRIEQMNSVYEASLGREERITQLKKEVNTELTRQGKTERYKIIEDRQ